MTTGGYARTRARRPISMLRSPRTSPGRCTTIKNFGCAGRPQDATLPADNDEEAHCSVADLDQYLASRGRASEALHRDPCDLRSGQGWKQPYASEAAAGWSSKDISRSLCDTVD